jgi:hypothetical protein
MLGDILAGRFIGKNGSDRYIWAACIDCGAERWVRMRKGNYAQRCRACGLRHNRCPQKIARLGVRTSDGYIRIHQSLVEPFFHVMALKGGSIPEHRLIMARHIGRNLHRWEVVHHINGIKDDNRIENLQLISDTRHEQITILENCIAQLEKENAILKSQLGIKVIV